MYAFATRAHVGLPCVQIHPSLIPRSLLFPMRMANPDGHHVFPAAEDQTVIHMPPLQSRHNRRRTFAQFVMGVHCGSELRCIQPTSDNVEVPYFGFSDRCSVLYAEPCIFRVCQWCSQGSPLLTGIAVKPHGICSWTLIYWAKIAHCHCHGPSTASACHGGLWCLPAERAIAADIILSAAASGAHV